MVYEHPLAGSQVQWSMKDVLKSLAYTEYFGEPRFLTDKFKQWATLLHRLQYPSCHIRRTMDKNWAWQADRAGRAHDAIGEPWELQSFDVTQQAVVGREAFPTISTQGMMAWLAWIQRKTFSNNKHQRSHAPSLLASLFGKVCPAGFGGKGIPVVLDERHRMVACTFDGFQGLPGVEVCMLPVVVTPEGIMIDMRNLTTNAARVFFYCSSVRQILRALGFLESTDPTVSTLVPVLDLIWEAIKGDKTTWLGAQICWWLGQTLEGQFVADREKFSNLRTKIGSLGKHQRWSPGMKRAVSLHQLPAASGGLGRALKDRYSSNPSFDARALGLYLTDVQKAFVEIEDVAMAMDGANLGGKDRLGNALLNHRGMAAWGPPQEIWLYCIDACATACGASCIHRMWSRW